MVSVSIIGVGRVGGAIALSLPKDKYSIEKLVVHGHSNVDSLIAGLPRPPDVTTLDALGDVSSDVIFITTQDSHIVAAAGALAKKVMSSPIVFHTSGSYSSSILDELKKAGSRTGSVHPLVSISKPELGPDRFRNAFFCVEGEPAAVEMGKQIVADLGGRPFSIDTKFKTLYHASAVTASENRKSACGRRAAVRTNSA